MESNLIFLSALISAKDWPKEQVKLKLTQKECSLSDQALVSEHENSDGTVLQQYLAEVESKEVFCGWIDSDKVEAEANDWAEKLGGLKLVFDSKSSYK